MPTHNTNVDRLGRERGRCDESGGAPLRRIYVYTHG